MDGQSLVENAASLQRDARKNGRKRDVRSRQKEK